MGNTISVIIALVGVLNFINSMVTAIVSRKKEFAMIQSVGMTKRQLRKTAPKMIPDISGIPFSEIGM